MRRNLILIASVGLNVGLAWMFLAGKPRRHSTTVQITNEVLETNAAKTHIVVRKQFFVWQELESPDYAVYIKNLRDIACPEQTVRDIIIADVNQLFAKRRAAEVPTPDQEWWRAVPDTNFVQMANAKAAAIEQERRQLLSALLGPDWNAAENQTHPLISLNGPVLGELSPETKNAVEQILARSQNRTQAYLNAQKEAGKPADPAGLARIGQQMRNELAQVLNAAQMEEFLLRYSQNAADLRQQLRGIEVTPDEFRNLFRLSDPIDQQIQLATGDDQTRAEQQATLAKQLVEDLKTILGPDRYQQYRMAQDPLYADAVNQANEAGAPPQAVNALYQLNKLIAQEKNRILNDPALTPEQQSAQLKNLEQQQQNSSDQILGYEPEQPPLPPPPLPTPYQVHPYSPGETIEQIAAQNGVSTTALLNANPNLNINNLNRGTPIIIPRAQ